MWQDIRISSLIPALPRPRVFVQQVNYTSASLLFCTATLHMECSLKQNHTLVLGSTNMAIQVYLGPCNNPINQVVTPKTAKSDLLATIELCFVLLNWWLGIGGVKGLLRHIATGHKRASSTCRKSRYIGLPRH